MSKASDKTYNQFRSDPDHAPSYLRQEYENGRNGVNKPTSKLALAAWRAGRDSAAAETEVVAAVA